MRRTLYIVAAVSMLAFVFIPAGTLTSQDRSWIDAVNGSMKRERVSALGKSNGEVIEPSPLDTRLREARITWTPDWRFLHDVRRSVFGDVVRYECGMAPPVYEIRSVLEDFGRTSSDKRLRAFVITMQSASESERRAAVQTAGEEGLGAMAARSGG